MTEGLGSTKRLLLLVSPATYRAGAFLEAARRLGIEVVRGVDVPAGLADWWDLPLPLDFANVSAAVDAIVAYAREHPFDAVVAVDDAATQLAAEAAPRWACRATHLRRLRPRAIRASCAT